jgi:hypothetical protein
MNDRADIYIFLSYTTREEEVRQVRPFVKEIATALRAKYGGVIDPIVWWDGDRMGDFMNESKLRAELADAITRCRHLLAFVSFSYWKSYWCRFEWEQAFQYHVRELAVAWSRFFGKDSRIFRVESRTWLSRPIMLTIPISGISCPRPHAVSGASMRATPTVGGIPLLIFRNTWIASLIRCSEA